MKQRGVRLVLALGIALGAVSCKRVMVPPAVDLLQHEVLGIVELAVNEQGKLAPYATRKFVQAITEDQKGIRIVELGRKADVLAEVGKAALSVRLVETGLGATVWSGSARDKRQVGNVTVFRDFFSFDAQDPEAAYGPLVQSLVRNAARDFRVTWKCVRG